MTSGPLHDLLSSLRRETDGPPRSDAQLLQQFAAGDEGAFELLVGRHGPMVFGVCRRVLGDPHETEDAFQATFLVLARRAESAARCRSLGAWLHTVAFRTALRARARRASRSAREQPLDDSPPAAAPDPARVAADRDAQRVIDEEVSRLPRRYRVPFVLYHLEGRSSAEVARELGCPVGTVDSWLTRARSRLRERLTRRGLAPASALFAALAPPRWSPARAAAVSAVLAAGRRARPRAVALAGEVVRALRASQVRAALLVLAVLATVATGLAAALRPRPVPAPRPPEAVTWAEPIRLGILRDGPADLSAIALSPDDKTLALASSSAPGPRRRPGGGRSGGVSLWDVEAHRWTARLVADARNTPAWPGIFVNKVNAVAFSPDGKTLASAGADTAVRLWDVARKQERAILRGHTVFLRALAFSPDGKTLASAGGVHPAALDHTVRLQFQSIPKELLKSGEIGELKVWDLATGRARTFFRGTTGRIYSVAFSPDGRNLVSGGRDGSLRLWDVAAGKQRACLQETGHDVPALAFSPDGRTLATANWGPRALVKLWDLTSGRVRARLAGPSGRSVVSVAFSPDGKVLAAALQVSPRDLRRSQEASGEVRLWDAVTGRLLGAPLTVGYYPVSMAFGRSGKILAVGGDRGDRSEITLLAPGSRR